jgi:hypothetical protein
VSRPSARLLGKTVSGTDFGDRMGRGTAAPGGSPNRRESGDSNLPAGLRSRSSILRGTLRPGPNKVKKRSGTYRSSYSEAESVEADVDVATEADG